MNIKERYQRQRTQFDQRLGEAKAVKTRCLEIDNELEELEHQVVLYGKSLALLHSLSSNSQYRLLNDIEHLVSDGLSAVFESDIKFKITPSIKGSQMYLDFGLTNEDGTETDLQDARGGGLVSLTGVLLRIVMLRLLSDRRRQILILDEVFSHLSDEFVPAAGELLKNLSEQLDIQIIMVSHKEQLLEYADTAYHLERQDDEVKFELVTV